MRANPQRLTALLQKQPPGVCLITGDEPLQRRECTDAVRAAARQAGAVERLAYDTVTGIDWDALALANQSQSLFAERRLIEITLHGAKPAKAVTEGIAALLEHRNDETFLLLVADKLDRASQSAKWFKAVESAGVLVQVWPVPAGELPQWLQRRMASRGGTLSAQAAAFIADRVEGNLLAAAQELEKIELYAGASRIELDDVLQCVTDSARYDVFGTVDEALAGNAVRAVRMVRGLRQEGTEVILLSWAVNREVRSLTSMRAAFEAGARADEVIGRFKVWSSRRLTVTAALKRHRLPAWQQLLRATARIDAMVKGAAAGEPWGELEWLLVRIAGVTH